MHEVRKPVLGLPLPPLISCYIGTGSRASNRQELRPAVADRPAF
jgi:hypothetical protein